MMESTHILLLIDGNENIKQAFSPKDTTTIAEGDAALKANLEELQNAAVDLLQALITFLLFVVSFIHAFIRLVHGCIGLLVWMFGAWIVGLKALQTKVDTLHARGSTWK